MSLSLYRYSDIMEKKVLLRLLVILLGLSWIVYAVAVPATRSSVMGKMDPSVQDQLVKEDLAMGLRNSKELFDMEKGDAQGRMVLEIADYSEPRANPAHNPRSPGHP